MIKNTHMDGHALFPPHPPVFLLTVITHLFLGLLPDITEIPLLVLSKAVKENLSPQFCWDPCSGLVLLEESLIRRRSQRLVSRRNMVPMLQETFFILDEEREGFGGLGPVLTSRKQQIPGISFGKLSGSSSRDRGMNVKLSSRFNNW